MGIFRKKSGLVSPPASDSRASCSKLGPTAAYLENFCRLYTSEVPEQKLLHISVRVACLRAAIWSRDLSNTKQTVLKVQLQCSVAGNITTQVYRNRKIRVKEVSFQTTKGKKKQQ